MLPGCAGGAWCNSSCCNGYNALHDGLDFAAKDVGNQVISIR
jgi:hypothetical protein